MIVEGAGDIALRDLGGVPVIWQDGVGVRQDPSYGQNVYSPGGVFQDDQGQLYQLGSDYHIRPYGGARTGGGTTNPATQPQAAGANTNDVLSAIGQLSARLQAQQTATPTTTTTTGARNLPAGAGTGAAAASGLSGLGNTLSTPVRIGGAALPLWAVGGGVFALMRALNRRRR